MLEIEMSPRVLNSRPEVNQRPIHICTLQVVMVIYNNSLCYCRRGKSYQHFCSFSRSESILVSMGRP